VVSNAWFSMIVERFQCRVVSGATAYIVLMIVGVGATGHAAEEPSVEIAKQWWSPQRNVWTPVGWKDHYFRFNVVYNGTNVAEPCPNFVWPRENAKPFLNQNLQLSFTPSPSDSPAPLPTEPTILRKVDGGVGIQGWLDGHATPVLWTDWPLQEGLVIRQEVWD
jgi:hypothetical protein